MRSIKWPYHRPTTHQLLYNHEYNKQIQSYSTKSNCAHISQTKERVVSLSVPSTRSTARIRWLIWCGSIAAVAARDGNGREKALVKKKTMKTKMAGTSSWTSGPWKPLRIFSPRRISSGTEDSDPFTRYFHDSKSFPQVLVSSLWIWELNWIDFIFRESGFFIRDLIFRGNLREWGSSYVRWPAGYCKWLVVARWNRTIGPLGCRTPLDTLESKYLSRQSGWSVHLEGTGSIQL